MSSAEKLKTNESEGFSLSLSAEELRALQIGIEKYLQERKNNLPGFLSTRLNLKECFHIQKSHLLIDLILNPINAVWAIPALTLRKALEAGEKLGWEKARQWTLKIPQAFQTNFQKQIAKVIKQDFFGLDSDLSILKAQLKIQPELEKILNGPQGVLLIHHLSNEISLEVDQYSVRQSGFTDLASSGALVLIADKMFGDRSLDLFGLGKKLASMMARRNAENKFFFGKTLGRTFYQFAPPPPPTKGEIILMTIVALFAFSFLSTIISVLSHPTQQKIGFRQNQFEKLIESLKGRILLKILNESKPL